MATYLIDLDYGAGGEETIECASVREALAIGCELAAEGDWPEECAGQEVLVRVLDEDGEEMDRTTWTIPTEDDRVVGAGEVLARRTHEYDTEQLVRIDGAVYYRRANGGERGAYDRQCGDGVWRDYPVEPAREISWSEARGLLLDWDYSPADVTSMTRVE